MFTFNYFLPNKYYDMLRKLIPIAALALGFAACSNPEGEAGSNGEADDALNTGFKQYANHFTEAMWQQTPRWATEMGYHKYDSLLPAPDAASRSASLVFIETQLDSLQAYDPAKLTASNVTDLKMIKNFLESHKWELTKLKKFEWDPTDYNVTGLIAFMLSEQYAPLDQRLKDCYKRLEQVLHEGIY
ncbi:MAG: DUF885 family protein, partial [Sphingobacteriales bacterium]